MGYFLACFGFKEKKKRLKPRNKNPSSDNQSYVPLDSNVATKLDIKENLTSDIPQLKDKHKEQSIRKLKKKVRFNLNVKAYEPIPHNDGVGIYLSDGEEDSKFVTETKSTINLQYDEDAIASSIITSNPASYRYQNCRYSDDEEDEYLNLDEIEESDEEIDVASSNYSDDGLPREEDFAWLSHNDVTKKEETSSVDLQHIQLQGIESKYSNARDRRQYVSSVLNPVENLSQWKVVKAKAATAQLKLQKENLMSKLDGNSLSSTNPYSESPTSLKMRNPNVAVEVRQSLELVDLVGDTRSSLREWHLSSVIQQKHDRRIKICSITD